MLKRFLMMASMGTSDEILRNSLKEFLDQKTKVEPNTRFCSECGSVCMSLDFHLCLDDEESGWLIQLPFCSQCNPELVRRKMYSA